MKSCNERMKRVLYVDTSNIERFYIELNDPISCRVSLASRNLPS